MRAPLVALLSLVASAPLVAAHDIVPIKLDLSRHAGTGGTTVAGYVAVPPGVTFDESSSSLYTYGWDAQEPTPSTFDTTIPNLVFDPALGYEPVPGLGESAEFTDLMGDGHLVTGSNTFSAWLPDGTYRVRVVLGQPDVERRAMQIYAGSDTSGVLLTPETHVALEFPFTGVWTRTLVSKGHLEPEKKVNNPESNLGGFRSLWVTVSVTNPEPLRLHFALAANTSEGTAIPVSVIEIYQHKELPASLVIDSVPELAVSSTYQWHGDTQTATDDAATFATAIAQVAANDLIAARATLGNLDDENDLARACGLLWIVGWLSGEPLFGASDLELPLIDEALALLWDPTTTSLNQDAALWRELRDRTLQYRRALLHNRLNGYPYVELAGTEYQNPYFGLPNAGLKSTLTAEALWRDAGSHDLNTVLAGLPTATSPGTQGAGPLFLKSSHYLALNFWQRNSINKVVTLGGSGKYSQVNCDIWRAFDTYGLHTFGQVGDPPGGLFETDASLAIGVHQAFHLSPGGLPAYSDLAQESGNLLRDWYGEGSDDVHAGVTTRWWEDRIADALALPVTGSGCANWSEWAAHQNRFRSALLAAHEWWATENHVDGEYGGGDGDDVEFLLQQLQPTVPFPGSAPLIEETAREVIKHNLDKWIDEGYFFGDGKNGVAADIEHTGEYTGNPIWASFLMDWGEPYNIEYAVQSTRRILEPVPGTGTQPPTPWTELVAPSTGDPLDGLLDPHLWPAGEPNAAPIDLRRFVSWHFDAEGAVLENAGTTPVTSYRSDFPINGRAARSAIFLNAYNRHPTSMRLMREWAEWWWTVAMDDGSLTPPDGAGPYAGQAKPEGLIPACAWYGQSPGTGGNYFEYGDPNADVTTDKYWWDGPKNPTSGADVGGYDYAGSLTNSQYTYGLFLWRYLDPKTQDDPSHDKKDYLLPIYRCAQIMSESWRRIVHRNEPGHPKIMDFGPGSAAVEGSHLWIASKMHRSPDLLWQVWEALPALELEYPDISGAGGTGRVLEYIRERLGYDPETIDPQFAAGLMGWQQMPYIRQILTGGFNEDAYTSGVEWIETYFPVFTEQVSYLDRVFIDTTDADNTQFESITGANLAAVPNHEVTWEAISALEDPSSGSDEPLQVAAFVKGWESDGVWRAHLTNYEAQPPGGTATARAVRARFWHGFPVGRYVMLAGPDNGSGVLNQSPDCSGTSAPFHKVPAGMPFEINPRDGSSIFLLDYATDPDCGVNWVIELHPCDPNTYPTTFNENITDIGLSQYSFDWTLQEIPDGKWQLDASVRVANCGVTTVTTPVKFGAMVIYDIYPDGPILDFPGGPMTFTGVAGDQLADLDVQGADLSYSFTSSQYPMGSQDPLSATVLLIASVGPTTDDLNPDNDVIFEFIEVDF